MPLRAIGEIAAVSNAIGLGIWYTIANMRRG